MTKEDKYPENSESHRPAPQTSWDDFVDFAKNVMREKGLTQTALAKLIHISQPHISEILTGKRDVKISTAIFAARVLGGAMALCPVEYAAYPSRHIPGLVHPIRFRKAQAASASLAAAPLPSVTVFTPPTEYDFGRISPSALGDSLARASQKTLEVGPLIVLK